MTKPKIICPTSEEDAEIALGIEADPDTQELTGEWFATAVRGADAPESMVPTSLRKPG
jgi:hypothetical protein